MSGSKEEEEEKQSLNQLFVQHLDTIHETFQIESKQNSQKHSIYDRLPPLSPKYLWFVGQNLEAKDNEFDIGDQIFYTIRNPLFRHRFRIPELHKRRIRAYFHGWVILSDHPLNINWSLWNPITCKLICFPQLNKKVGQLHECCLSSPPDDPSSIILLTTVEKPTFIFCRTGLKRKKLRWTEMSYAKQLRSIRGVDAGFLENPTCCNGKVYAVSSGPYCIVIQVDIVVTDKEVVINLLPFVKEPDICLNRCPFYSDGNFNFYIKGYCTDLFYIGIGFEDEARKTVNDVYFYKLNKASMIWEEMKDLKNAIFFAELNCSHEDCVFYKPEIASAFGGYIHILDKRSKVIYSYNIKGRTISICSMPCLVQDDQSQVTTSAMLEFRLNDHAHDSKQQEEVKDYEIVERLVARDEVKLQNRMDESHLLNVPFDVLETIMDFCVGVDYLNFRVVCKRCRIAAPPVQWGNGKSLWRLRTYSLISPWLMVFDNHQGIITFTDPLLGDKYYIKIPQELIGFQIYCSRYGWLLMYKINGPMVFYNPFTNDIRELPGVCYLESLCFSAPPTSPNCIVVGFKTRGEEHIVIHFVAGEPFWYELGGGSDPHSFRFPTFYGQDLYALCDDRGIDVFRNMGLVDSDLDCDWVEVVAEAPRSCCMTRAKRFLAKCDQHLIQVTVGQFGESIEVFNLNESNQQWERVYGLGKHMIFISRTTCLCIEAKSPGMENKIYFPRLHSANGKIVFYSFETCRYGTFNGTQGEETLGDLFDTEYHTSPHTWIEPTWS